MRIGRKRTDDSATQDEPVDSPPPGQEAGTPLPSRERETPEAGPFDVADVDLEEEQLIDLGSMLLPAPTGPESPELRLQVEEKSGEVMSILLVGKDGALELRAFAASRGGGAWDELRPRIVAETSRLGGQVKEQQGTFGTELVALVPVKGPDGEQATQASRISGHEGPTWLLRANLMGNPAVKPELAGPWEEIVRSVVVRRGPGAMAPGTALPLTLPPEARRADGG